MSIIPLISSANAQGHPGMDRSWAIFNLHEEQSNENHISIKHSPKKKSARLCVYLPGDNQQHLTWSGNECHVWFLRLCHRRPKLITRTRTWLLLASGVVLQTVIYKGLYGIDRFFLKEIKNVMFLNKIDVPYCLVVFFVVCPRLRPFWSVFGELALFWCPTANTLGTRGFSRVRREFSVGRSHERVTIKTWQKPETALEKSLAPRVHC